MLELVVCPTCRGSLLVRDASADDRYAVLGHNGGPCPEIYPVIGNVARLLVGPARAEFCRERRDWFSASPFGARFGHWTGTAPETEW